MTLRRRRIAAVALLAAVLVFGVRRPAAAHRLDEYLQAATLSLAKDRIHGDLRMTPGVAVFPKVLSGIDANGDGALSPAEKRAYAARVLGDLALTVDGRRLPLRLDSYAYPDIAAMKGGVGVIDIAFDAPVAPRDGRRVLTFENRHDSAVAVYLANCLVPADAGLLVTGQSRDFRQSRYRLEYAEGTAAVAAARAAGSEDAAASVPGSALPTAVVGQFVAQGILHIFTGPDHILFLLGLLLLGGSLPQLLKIVTAFTVAHSVTLCLAALGIVSPPARLIEPAIALSIVFVGVHDLRTIRRRGSGAPAAAPDARLLFAFFFGLVHGFGFANALAELALPRQALAAALFSFNLGVECGQACIVLAVAPMLAWLHRANLRLEGRFVIGGSAVVSLAGLFWFVQRVLAG